MVSGRTSLSRSLKALDPLDLLILPLNGVKRRVLSRSSFALSRPALALATVNAIINTEDESATTGDVL